MICFDAHIANSAFVFFQRHIEILSDYSKANGLIKSVCGINHFFASQQESDKLSVAIQNYQPAVLEPNRREYGDFQTNPALASGVLEYILKKDDGFEFVLEPTCGRGNFILSSIQHIKSLKKIVGVEIYRPYVWETKFNILNYFLEHQEHAKPDIDIFCENAFDFSYERLAKSTKHLKTLVVGNPPWVTNAELGRIDSENLPKKSNFKNHSGLEAMTGKGNFDIGEFLSLMMLNSFQNHNGIFAFLIKNATIRNIIYEQKRNKYKIGKPEKLSIDAKKEFDASVNASLFMAYLGVKPNFACKEIDFYDKSYQTTFGWYKDKFVYSVDDYDKSSELDGQSVFVWRSGVKHDCSKVMEFERANGHFLNVLGLEVAMENELVYALLKSSDLKAEEVGVPRKFTIITQNKIGQETGYIQKKYPLTYQYLSAYKTHFDKRKSSIYKGKPDFSIFGIGDYSFAPYKVAISGLYKTTHFTIVKPYKNKPVMLDDTCYFIGFDELKMAEIAHCLLNSALVQEFLHSIIFTDAKRPINKDILMRIDFERAFSNMPFDRAKQHISNLTPEDWQQFGQKIQKNTTGQIALFG